MFGPKTLRIGDGFCISVLGVSLIRLVLLLIFSIVPLYVSHANSFIKVFDLDIEHPAKDNIGGYLIINHYSYLFSGKGLSHHI